MPTRKSIRLNEQGYAQGHDYFITICLYEGQGLFGRIENGKMILNDAGHMVDHWWKKMFEKFSTISDDAFAVMPDHMHGIIHSGRPHGAAPTNRATTTIIDMIGWFKTMTTNDYIRHVKDNEWEPFQTHLWQRSFHDRIIRNAEELEEIRDYIKFNVCHWQKV
jgi:REP element-mobilizing transposase RayT